MSIPRPITALTFWVPTCFIQHSLVIRLTEMILRKVLQFYSKRSRACTVSGNEYCKCFLETLFFTEYGINI